MRQFQRLLGRQSVIKQNLDILVSKILVKKLKGCLRFLANMLPNKVEIPTYNEFGNKTSSFGTKFTTVANIN